MQPQNGQNKDTSKPQELSWSQPQKPATQHTEQKTQAPAQMQKQSTSNNKAALMENQSNAAKITGWLAAGIVAGVVIAWGATGVYKNNSGPASTTTQNTASNATSTSLGQGSDPSLTITSPQKAGESVSIAKAIVSEPTWIVVYESRDGKPGNVLGAALFFPDRQAGSVELLRGTVAGQSYFVTKVTDNGDHKFSLKDDKPLVEGGEQMWVTFSAN